MDPSLLLSCFTQQHVLELFCLDDWFQKIEVKLTKYAALKKDVTCPDTFSFVVRVTSIRYKFQGVQKTDVVTYI